MISEDVLLCPVILIEGARCRRLGEQDNSPARIPQQSPPFVAVLSSAGAQRVRWSPEAMETHEQAGCQAGRTGFFRGCSPACG
jgi:hypothetical protein